MHMVYKMTLVHCFLLALEALKWPSEKHQSSEKCIYFQTLLFVPFMKLFLERFQHQYDAPRPPQFAIYFRSGGCFEHTGAQLNMDQFDLINNRMIKFVVSYRVVFKQVEVSTIISSVECTGSWLNAGTFPVFMQWIFLEILHNIIRTHLIILHINQPAYFMERNTVYIISRELLVKGENISINMNQIRYIHMSN